MSWEGQYFQTGTLEQKALGLSTEEFFSNCQGDWKLGAGGDKVGFSDFTVLEVVSEGVGGGEVGTRQPGCFPVQPRLHNSPGECSKAQTYGTDGSEESSECLHAASRMGKWVSRAIMNQRSAWVCLTLMGQHLPAWVSFCDVWKWSPGKWSVTSSCLGRAWNEWPRRSEFIWCLWEVLSTFPRHYNAVTIDNALLVQYVITILTTWHMICSYYHLNKAIKWLEASRSRTQEHPVDKPEPLPARPTLSALPAGHPASWLRDCETVPSETNLDSRPWAKKGTPALLQLFFNAEKIINGCLRAKQRDVIKFTTLATELSSLDLREAANYTETWNYTWNYHLPIRFDLRHSNSIN